MPDSTPEPWLPTRGSRLTLAQRIQICMELGRPDKALPWTSQGVRDALAERGVTVSQSYFSGLRSGARSEPSLSVLRGLAKVFGVPLDYFTADDEEAAALELSLRDPQQVVRQALSHAGEQPLSLAERIDRCFRIMHPRDRGEFSYREVSEGVAALGAKMSASYLWQLRHGERDNPSLRQIEALARFFHIPASYFNGTPAEVEEIDAEMSFVEVMRKPEIAGVALRATTLNTEGLRAITDVLEAFSKNPAFIKPADPPDVATSAPAEPRPSEDADGHEHERHHGSDEDLPPDNQSASAR